MSDPMFEHKAVLPYGGKSQRGSDQQKKNDESGATTARQATTIQFVRDAGEKGVTSKDLREQFGWHHGQASGAASVLHKAGLIVRLAKTRDHYGVYVVPEHIAGRDTREYQPAAGPSEPVEVIRHVGTVEIKEVPKRLSPDDTEFVSRVFAKFALLDQTDAPKMNLKTETVRRLLNIVAELQEEPK
jgi:DNA-binding MarR family transcriptional regulator